MTVQECYAALGGDYEDVLSRLRTEERVRKFVLKFLDDPSYDELLAALDEGRSEDAFRAAHTIKGVCQNLSFTALYQASTVLADALRTGQPASDTQLAAVQQAYRRTADAIGALQQAGAD